MFNLLLSLDAVEARCARLRELIASEPEFANWGTADAKDCFYVIVLFPLPTLTVDEIADSAAKLQRAIGGEWKAKTRRDAVCSMWRYSLSQDEANIVLYVPQAAVRTESLVEA